MCQRFSSFRGQKTVFLKGGAGGGLYEASMTFRLGALKQTPCLAKSKIICKRCFEKSLFGSEDCFSGHMQRLKFPEASLCIFCFQPFQYSFPSCYSKYQRDPLLNVHTCISLNFKRPAGKNQLCIVLYVSRKDDRRFLYTASVLLAVLVHVFCSRTKMLWKLVFPKRAM